MNEERLSQALREAPVPDEAGAADRGLAVVRAARAAGAAHPAPRRRARLGRRGVQVAVALGLLAVLVSPAGAAVRDWVGDAVEDERPPAQPALTSLPAPGNLLVDSPRGPWLVRADGSKRLLGDFEKSTWSPHGLFVAAADRHELAALDPEGAVRWTISRAGPVRDPAWSPDGYRIAYLNGAELRMVAGDGTGDRLLSQGVAPVAPAWQPTGARVLTYVRRDGTIRTIRADSGETLFSLRADGTNTAAMRRESSRRPRQGGIPLSISWSADGSRLLVVHRDGLEAFDREGRLAWRAPAPPATEVDDAVVSADGASAATVLAATGGARGSLRLLGPGGGGQTLFEGLGRFDQAVYSPGGQWLLLTWPSADQWLFLNPSHPRRVVAIADISAQFDPGTTSAPGFPRIAGWCCPPR